MSRAFVLKNIVECVGKRGSKSTVTSNMHKLLIDSLSQNFVIINEASFR